LENLPASLAGSQQSFEFGEVDGLGEMGDENRGAGALDDHGR